MSRTTSRSTSWPIRGIEAALSVSWHEIDLLPLLGRRAVTCILRLPQLGWAGRLAMVLVLSIRPPS
ncbi:uncharacterized protein B0I36DRAFT_309160 [Microdochium trichocladiopsis]|uniref:Uncharacterized protein n=1 Tax=Microdochium trichocladiopsis TaxID=1682393 RepID=A0A9P8YG21_9PEZI|nr:uncharacterized protein B0I36DRAFT_309160 [Microdochium trichocladiopsis]KAH7039724.1 hypothetical protein B0I36DRAFT_309160 [Microdochium trichocladiopsis]